MRYLNEFNFKYLCDGLTLDDRDLEVLDDSLDFLDKENGIVSRIIKSNHNDTIAVFKCEGPQLILTLDKISNKDGSILGVSTVRNHKTVHNVAPVLHINLHSPVLNIPQRIEIPIRYMLKGYPSLIGTHMVYLHAIQINNTEEFVYYRITKRGWMKRFQEHTRIAIKGGSSRKFAKILGDSINARLSELYSTQHMNTKLERLTGSYHVVCTAGRTKTDAREIEKYLIEKYSLEKIAGLNMIK